MQDLGAVIQEDIDNISEWNREIDKRTKHLRGKITQANKLIRKKARKWLEDNPTAILNSYKRDQLGQYIKRPEMVKIVTPYFMKQSDPNVYMPFVLYHDGFNKSPLMDKWLVAQGFTAGYGLIHSSGYWMQTMQSALRLQIFRNTSDEELQKISNTIESVLPYMHTQYQHGMNVKMFSIFEYNLGANGAYCFMVDAEDNIYVGSGKYDLIGFNTFTEALSHIRSNYWYE